MPDIAAIERCIGVLVDVESLVGATWFGSEITRAGDVGDCWIAAAHAYMS